MVEKHIDLTINKLSKAKYDQLSAAGQLSADELYVIEVDSDFALSADVDRLVTELDDKIDDIADALDDLNGEVA